MTTQKCVLVTGASSGMGKACAERLLRGGFRVFAAVRKEADGEALQRKGAEPVILDVTRSETIAQAARAIKSLDALVNTPASPSSDRWSWCRSTSSAGSSR